MGIKKAFLLNKSAFFSFIFSLVNVTSALKTLFLFLDYNVRMVCVFNPFCTYYMPTWLHTLFFFYIFFLSKYKILRYIPKIIQKKYRDIIFCSYHRALLRSVPNLLQSALTWVMGNFLNRGPDRQELFQIGSGIWAINIKLCRFKYEDII